MTKPADMPPAMDVAAFYIGSPISYTHAGLGLISGLIAGAVVGAALAVAIVATGGAVLVAVAVVGASVAAGWHWRSARLDVLGRCGYRRCHSHGREKCLGQRQAGGCGAHRHGVLLQGRAYTAEAGPRLGQHVRQRNAIRTRG